MIRTVHCRPSFRLIAWALAVLMAGPVILGVTGCGNSGSGSASAPAASGSAPTSSAAPVGNTQSVPPPSTAPAPAAPAAKPGLSNGQKAVIVLAGAALLYYLYRKHQAAQQAQGAATAGHPQLYRSQNGGVYYRDPQNPQKVTWLTVPNQPVQVPAGDVQRYAPDYQQYQGQAAPAAPAGAPQQSFSQFDGAAAGGQ